MILEEKYTLSNGIDIPKIGLGTWFISNENAGQAVKEAAKIGYRHIDTAQAYDNESGVGDGIRACGVKREEMFVTTKLAAEIKSYKEAVVSIDTSLKTMGLDYLDLMIIHSPQPWAKFGEEERFFGGNREAWRALEEAYKAKGIEDAVEREASPVPPDLDKDAYGAKVRAKLAGLEKDISGAKWQLFSPAMDTFLKEHLFADIFVRDIISHQDRELTTIAALANMTGTKGQLGFHLGAAMNTGLTQAQMKEFISVLKTRVDKAQAESAQKILTEVMKNRK